MSGAIEGFLQGLEEQDLTQTAKESLQTAGEVARETGTEVRSQADAPELRELARDVSGAVGRVADNVKGTAQDVKSTAQDIRYQVGDKVESAKGTVHDAAVTVKERYHSVKEGVKVRADAVKESSRRAGRAPRRIGHELGQAFASWKNALVASIAMMAGLFVLGIVTLVVLTIAMVAGLNQVLGDPKGTWLTFAIYSVVMIILWAVMRTRRASARAQTRRRIENAKQEVRHVGAPVRRAFSGRGGAQL